MGGAHRRRRRARRTSRRPSRRSSSRTSGSPRRNLTIQYGLRWEAQLAARPDHPGRARSSTRPSSAPPAEGVRVPVRRRRSRPTTRCSSRAWASPGTPRATARRWCALNGGIFYGRIPGLSTASSRSTNGSRGQTLFRNSALTGFWARCPPIRTSSRSRRSAAPVPARRVRVRQGLPEPAHLLGVSVAVEREIVPRRGPARPVQPRQGRAHHPLRERQRPAAGLGPGPSGLGLAPGGQRHRHPDRGGLERQEPLPRLDLRPHQALVAQLPVPGQLHVLARTYSDDDNERDPFTFRYAQDHATSTRSTASPTATSATASTAGCSGRRPGAVNVNLRYSYRSAQPQLRCKAGRHAVADAVRGRPLGPHPPRRQRRAAQHRPQGQRLLVARPPPLARVPAGGRVSLEPILDVFNLFNSTNFTRPEVTNLIFNFDGTVQSGLGDPRQAQLGSARDFLGDTGLARAIGPLNCRRGLSRAGGPPDRRPARAAGHRPQVGPADRLPPPEGHARRRGAAGRRGGGAARRACACARSATRSPTARSAPPAPTPAGPTASICVVEEPHNLVAVERTRDFRGRYHVLHGSLSPLQGVGPDQLEAPGPARPDPGRRRGGGHPGHQPHRRGRGHGRLPGSPAQAARRARDPHRHGRAGRLRPGVGRRGDHGQGAGGPSGDTESGGRGPG